MSIDRFLVTPLTIVEPGSTENRYTDQAIDFDHPISETETFGWFAQMSTVEDIGGRDVVVTVDKLFLAAGTSISSAARVVGNGHIYEVAGAANHAPTPSGEHHVEVTLRVVEEIESEVVS